MEKYLVINGGSSSLKFSLYEMPDKIEIVNGNIEKIGSQDSFLTLKVKNQKLEIKQLLKNHNEAVLFMIKQLLDNKFIYSIDEIKGIGHRVLHGGEFYNESVLIDDGVIENIEALTKFGPLHHPGELAGIKAMKACLPNVLQVAVFDTAFHQTMPMENYIYPVPLEWYTKYGVRKYGFHGTSHKYITKIMSEKLNIENPNLIICHIGNGASICAVKDGKSFNTTMGLTPLDGLMMGTRCGDIDTSIIEYINEETGLDIDSIIEILNTKSGLYGIAGKNDMRDINSLIEQGDKKALLAYRMYCNRIVGYIMQYIAELDGNVDAICFTAGVLENNINLRKYIIGKLANVFPIKINNDKNNHISGHDILHEGLITTNDSKYKVYVEQTDEEIMILDDTYQIASQIHKKGSR